MTPEQIGLVIQLVKDCGKEVTAELVLYVCNIIDPSITYEQVVQVLSGQVIAEGMFQAEKDMQKLETAMWKKYQAGHGIEPLRDPMTGVDGYVCDPRQEEF